MNDFAPEAADHFHVGAQGRERIVEIERTRCGLRGGRGGGTGREAERTETGYALQCMSSGNRSHRFLHQRRNSHNTGTSSRSQGRIPAMKRITLAKL
jgi:hypothetical protein